MFKKPKNDQSGRKRQHSGNSTFRKRSMQVDNTYRNKKLTHTSINTKLPNFQQLQFQNTLKNPNLAQLNTMIGTNQSTPTTQNTFSNVVQLLTKNQQMCEDVKRAVLQSSINTQQQIPQHLILNVLQASNHYQAILFDLSQQIGHLNQLHQFKQTQQYVPQMIPQTNLNRSFSFILSNLSFTEKLPNFEEKLQQIDSENKNSFTGIEAKLNSDNEDEECSICLEPLNLKGPLKSTGKCKHIFHAECLENVLKHDNKCPVCRIVIKKKFGPCPNGYMSIAKIKEICCEGYDGCGTIIIFYQILPGVQQQKHLNPGVKHDGTKRYAFLPNNNEGIEVLQLLKKAWEMKLTFTVGRSLTSGQNNVVTWNDIHHKTTLDGGPYGYPDTTYLQRVTADLNALGINLDE